MYSYSKETSLVVVSVFPEFSSYLSQGCNDHYEWKYRIKIENKNSFPITILSHSWSIFEISGSSQIIEGKGILGIQPLIHYHDSFVYESGIVMTSNSGSMSGYYIVIGQDIGEFRVNIPCFFLESDESKKFIN